MRFAIQPHPLGDYVSKHSRRVRLIPAEDGTEFPDLHAFAERHNLIPVDVHRLREAQIAQLGKDLESTFDGGITVAGITLGALVEDQNAFARLLVLLRETEELLPDADAKRAFQSGIHTITDKLGTPHYLAVRDLRAILVAYGHQIAGLWSASAQQRALLTSAKTTAEVINVLNALFGRRSMSSNVGSGSEGSTYSIGAHFV